MGLWREMAKWPNGGLQQLHDNCPGQGYGEGDVLLQQEKHVLVAKDLIRKVPVYAQYVG